ncbi:helix-turn-helix domain-containing protein [Kribbella jejuensis]|uniref:Helix-turn-helix protein n=1 Tax=Kribbella jejuensis TaxID=236068 RepID=A0A542EW59_9ACTN|nr:helix-turn-helix domain-containing protein [Kribbella jejuensis]TQJ19600.1 helix-turn-helix protein [Kribbella jejuensis]
MAPSPEAVRLARRLRELRESERLTQKELSNALSVGDGRVAVATISSWESQSNPKLPPEERLRAYALLFASSPAPKRVPREQELAPAHRERFNSLHRELVNLRDEIRQHQTGRPQSSSSYTFDFESGRITLICPEVPEDGRSSLGQENNPNFTKLYKYADLDALIEMWGHVRASNPELRVRHRLPSEVSADHLSGHLILIGGIAWNRVTSRLLRVLDNLPIRQMSVPDLADGEIFRSRDGREYRPVWEESKEPVVEEAPSKAELEAEQAQDAWRGDTPRELVEDVALFARLPNPFNHSRTITICNGVYSRGVLGAVRTLTDDSVRERNEAYLANRFPGGVFGLLMRVPVVNGEAVTPDLEIPENRLFEWSPEDEDE